MKQYLLLPLLLAAALLAACDAPAPTPLPHGGPGGAGGAGGDDGTGGGDGLCGPLALGGAACGPGSCWAHPHPAPLDVHAGATTADGGLWLVGEGSAPLRWDGHGWRVAAEGLDVLDGPAGQRIVSRGQEAWWVRAGRLHHWDGARWGEVDFGRFHPHPTAVWALEESLWVTGNDVRRFDGLTWASLPVEGGPFSALWGKEGEGYEEVWAVGAKGAIHRWLDGRWETLASGVGTHLRGVWGSGPGDVWVVGDAGTLLHWDGEAFTEHHALTRASFTHVAGAGPDDVFALAYDASDATTTLYRWNGSLWTVQRLPGELAPRSLWQGEEGVWVGAAGGGLAHWRDGCWAVHEPPPARFSDLRDGWAVGPDGWVARDTGHGWEVEQIAPGQDLHSVTKWGGEVWIAGSDGLLLRGDDEGFRPFGDFGEVDLLVVRGHDDGDLWIGGRDGSLHRFDGRSIGRSPSPTPWPIRSIVASAGEAWATTEVLHEVLRWDGQRWERARGAWGAPTLLGASAGDLWLLSSMGSGGATVERWDGAEWRLVPARGPTTVRSIGGVAGRVFVGHGPGVVHAWDGATWSARDVAVQPRALAHGARGLWVLGDRHLLARAEGEPDAIYPAPEWVHALWAEGDEVWVAGARGFLATIRDERLVAAWAPTDQTLRALGGSTGDLWAAGDGGALLHFDGATWRDAGADVTADLHAVAARDDAVWVVGAEGTILSRTEGGWVRHPGPTSTTQDDEEAPEVERDWIAALLTSDGELWLAARDGGLYARGVRGDWREVDPDRVAAALWEDESGRIWVGGPPADDGSHLVAWNGSSWERHDVGVVHPLETAVPLGADRLAVARGARIDVVDGAGGRRPLGTAPGPVRLLAPLSEGNGLRGLGRGGGIFHLLPQG